MTATDAPTTPSAGEVRAATRATYAAFIGAGFAFASWAARIPQVRTRLDLDPADQLRSPAGQDTGDVVEALRPG